MIHPRRLLLALLVAAVGWQIAARLTDGQPVAVGILLIALGLGGCAWALKDAAGSPQSTAGRGRLAGALLGILVVQFAVVPALVAFLARWREVPGLASALAGAARALGVSAAASGENVVLHTGGAVLDYFPSLSRLGAFPLLLALASVGAVTLFMPISRPARFLGRFALALGGVALARIFLLLLARLDLPEMGVESSPWLTLLTLAPAAFLLPRAISPAPTSAGAAAGGVPRWRMATAALAGAAWVIALGWVDPGQPKAGRILFDDAHGEWEPTDVPFDRNSFGQRLAYSYSSLFQLLDWHYDARRHRQGLLDAEALEGVDILLVKTPTTAYSDVEVAAIEAFVHRGGGLFLVGDHTNLFGMSTHLNRLAHRFRLSFVGDDTFALPTEAQSYWEAPRWLAHPIARRIGDFEFETSCTIRAPLTARAPMIGYGLGAEPADYSRPGYFGDLHPGLSEDYGFFVQYAVVDHGRGRVAAFSDSTTFSNFSLFFPGRREMVLATMEHLNRANTWSTHLPMAALLVSIGALFALGGRRKGTAPLATALALLAGIVGGSLFVERAGGDIELPELDRKIPRIAFDRSISDLVLPGVLTVDTTLDTVAMDTFLVTAQRLGYRPSVGDDLEKTLKEVDAIVFFHPKRALSHDESVALQRFVARGGGVLVVDGLLQRGAATEALVSRFGFRLSIDAAVEAAVVARPAVAETEATPATLPAVVNTAEESELGFSRPVMTLRGGTPVLLDEAGRAIYSEVRRGGGRVGVLVDSFTLSKGQLGSRFTDNPTPQQRANLETVFLALQRIVEGPEAAPLPVDVPLAPPPGEGATVAEGRAEGKIEVDGQDAEADATDAEDTAPAAGA